MNLSNFDILLSTLFIIPIILTILTYLRVKMILKRDGPAKIEVNQRYSGVLLEHAEAIEPTSPLFATFYLLLLPPQARIFFKDFEGGDVHRMWISSMVIRIVLMLLAVVFLLNQGHVLSFGMATLLLILQNITHSMLSNYYFLRYYEVDFEIEYIDDDKDHPDSDTDR